MKSDHLSVTFTKKDKNYFQKIDIKIIISFLWFIFWMLIYLIFLLIEPMLIFIPMLLNLPLASFFCIGIILETLTIIIFNIDESYDIIGKIIVISFTFSLNYIYRQVIFKQVKKNKLPWRLQEFFMWLLPWLIIISILGKISSLIQ